MVQRHNQSQPVQASGAGIRGDEEGTQSVWGIPENKSILGNSKLRLYLRNRKTIKLIRFKQLVEKSGRYSAAPVLYIVRRGRRLEGGSQKHTNSYIAKDRLLG